MEELLSTKQAAARLDKSPEAVRWHVKAGNLTPAVKMPGESGAFLFRPEDVDALIEHLNDRRNPVPATGTVSTSPADGAGQALADTTSGGEAP